MKNLKDFDKQEIEIFNDDNAGITYKPNNNCKFILSCEQLFGQYEIIDKVYILHIDENGNEICRYDALSSMVTAIYWKNN